MITLKKRNGQPKNNCCHFRKFEQGPLLYKNMSKRRRQNGKQCRPWLDCSFRQSDQGFHCLLRPVCMLKYNTGTKSVTLVMNFETVLITAYSV